MTLIRGLHKTMGQTYQSNNPSEEVLRQFVQNAPVAIAMFDASMCYLAFSERWRTDYGLALPNLLGRCHYDIFPDIPKQWKAAHRDGLAGKTVSCKEDCFARDDGSSYWLRWEVQPWYTNADTIGGIILFTEDISDLKRSEQQLNEILLKNTEAIKAARVGLWDWNLLTSEVRFSAQWKAQIGYGEDEISDIYEEWEQRLHPEDRAEVLKKTAVAIQELKQDHEIVFRFRHKDGSYRWILAQGTVLADAQGRAARIIGSHIDITESKRIEEELKESRSLFRTLIRAIPDLVWLKDVDGAYLMCNARFEEFFGTSEQRIIGRTDHDFVDEELADFFRWHDLLAIEKGLPVMNEETVFFANDGHREVLETIKTPFYTNNGELAGVLGIGRDITARKIAEKALLESEERFKRALENIPDVVIIYDRDLVIQYINAATTKLTGIPAASFIGRRDEELWDEDVYGQYLPTLKKTLVTGRSQTAEIVVELAAGYPSHLRIVCVPLMDSSGNVREILGITHDLTESLHAEKKRAEMEDRLRQAQKMEAVGNLAGGVAHDYNNMLSIILGYAEMGLEEAGGNERLRECLQEIGVAGRRSTEITRQLLAFARQQPVAPAVLDLNDTVEGMLKMLRRLIGENIDLAWLPGRELWPLKVDPSQIDQILANLCVNGRDAIDDVGRIVIETVNVTLDEARCTDYPDVSAGDYVCLSVSDNGNGISEDNLPKIFEPFFTTKDVGRGTGLGLATVYGVTKQNKGQVTVTSVLGQGTTFHVYLPRYRGEGVHDAKRPSTDCPAGRGETIMLVEDDGALLRLGKSLLERLGYQVIACSSPSEALDFAVTSGDVVDLLLTDVIMPEMNGHALVAEIKSIVPRMKVLYTSGYTANVIEEYGNFGGEEAFLQKPFTKKSLAEKVRKLLDA